MICVTRIGGQIWNKTLPNTSQNVIFVEGLKQTICVRLNFYSPCLFLFENGKIFLWILLWVYPTHPRATTLFGSLWTVSLSLLIFFQWTLNIQPRSMLRYILIELRPYMKFPLLSSLIGGQFLSLISRSNCNNFSVLASLEAQLIIHKLMAKLKEWTRYSRICWELVPFLFLKSGMNAWS